MNGSPLLRLLLRGLAWSLAIVALLSPFAGWADLMSALLGVGVGLAVGELARRRAVKSRWIVVAGTLACLLGPLLAGALTETFVARLLGPGLALSLAGWAVFGVVATAVVAMFRALGARHDTARGLEAVVLGASAASVFASHRDGAVGRPLAVADLAWTLGLDPRTLLFGIGGATALVLLALLAVEHVGRIRRGALIVLPALLALGWLLVGVAGVTPPPTPQTEGTSKENGDLPRAAPDKPPVDVPPQGGGGAPPPEDAPSGGQTPDPKSPEGGAQGGPTPPPDGAEAKRSEGQATPGAQGPEGQTQEAGDAPNGGPTPDGAGAKPSKPGQRSDAPQGSHAEGAKSDAKPDTTNAPDAAGARPRPEGEAGGSDGAADAAPDAPPGAPERQEEPAKTPPPDRASEPKPDPDQAGGGGQSGSGEGGGAQGAQPVAVVVLNDDYEPPRELWYLRQGALSVFNGHRLVPASPGSGLDGDLIRELPTQEVASAAPPPKDVRFELTGSVAILVDHPLPFGPDFPVSYAPLPNPDPSRFLRAWSFRAAVNPVGFEGMLGHTSNGPNVTPEQRQVYLTAPTDPRYRALADEIVADLSASAAADPLARALAVKRWLDDHMVGDSSRRHEGEGDPTADFLFGDLHGYCVHGAHASVYLDRLLGVPSRVGTGYAVPASDRRGSTLVVRSHQAHAWPEIWLDGIGWVAVDPTPRQIVDPPAPPLDEDVARQLGEQARQTPPEADIPPTPRDWLRELMPSLRSVAVGLWTVLRALAALAVLAVYAAKIWFAWCPWWLQADLPRVAYRAGLHRLTALGLGRDEGESREQHARRVVAIAPSMEALTEAHVAAAFGSDGGPSIDASTWRAWVAAVRQESALTVPWWRRALAWIDPTSPFRTR